MSEHPELVGKGQHLTRRTTASVHEDDGKARGATAPDLAKGVSGLRGGWRSYGTRDSDRDLGTVSRVLGSRSVRPSLTPKCTADPVSLLWRARLRRRRLRRRGSGRHFAAEFERPEIVSAFR